MGGIVNQFCLLNKQYVYSRESKVSNHKIGRGVVQVKACPYQNHIIQRRDNYQSFEKECELTPFMIGFLFNCGQLFTELDLYPSLSHQSHFHKFPSLTLCDKYQCVSSFNPISTNELNTRDASLLLSRPAPAPSPSYS